MCVSDCMVFKNLANLFVSFLLQLINYLTCSTMSLGPNIDQMYKKMKKIVEVGNGDEFTDFADLFFFLA
jgi:hypothetical protein